MKKLFAAILTFATIMTAGISAMAGTFDDYQCLELTEGTYTYVFPRLKISMDEYWYRHTKAVVSDGGSSISFYHTRSYAGYASEGVTGGGLLLTIGTSVNTDFQILPDFTYLGFDEDEALNYYAARPTDYQAYVKNEAVRAEYDKLFSSVDDVIRSIQLKSSVEQAAAQDQADSAAPWIITTDDYVFLINDGTATIAKYIGDAEEVTIPAETGSYPVTAIGRDAFEYKEMKSLYIPDSISNIGSEAFEYCVVTDSLRLPANVTISKDAFCYAALPAAVVIPSGATVEERAFGYIKKTERVCIDPDVKLKGRAFAYCDGLKQVACADGTRMERAAFEYCKNLETVIFCGNVRTENESFSYCRKAKITTGGDYEALRPLLMDGSLDSHANADPKETVNKEIVLSILGSPVTEDGVTVTLDKATAVGSDTGFTYTLAGKITNSSGVGITQVAYTIDLIDADGTAFRSFALVYDGEDTAITPQGTIDFFHDDITWGKRSVPAAVKIGIFYVRTEAELPPSRLPQAGDCLYQALGDEKLANIKEEPPVGLSFHIDRGGNGMTATFTEGAALDRAVDLLCAIKVGEETNEWVTDNYNSIVLTWKDGTQTYISLNLRNLEYSAHPNATHTYELDNLDAFWSYCAGYMRQDGF